MYLDARELVGDPGLFGNADLFENVKVGFVNDASLLSFYHKRKLVFGNNSKQRL